MKLLLATDAWEPQINGVVRTLQATIACLKNMGIDVHVVEPSMFRTAPLPTYPDIRIAFAGSRRLKQLIATIRPDAVHISTEGPIGLATRRACLATGRAFTTSYHTRFPEYVQARAAVPLWLSYALLRRFHARSNRVLVSTERLKDELMGHGFQRLGVWPRGVDTDLFAPGDVNRLDLPRPIFLSVGRIAIEKNLQAFLSLDLPGSMVVVGDGPQRPELQLRYPKVHFLGAREGAELASIYASADVFVFPSLTDTYGIVLLEAAAAGLPTAAFPVPGPLDVVGGTDVAVLDADLRSACMAALRIPRERCRQFALSRSWAAATRLFAEQVLPEAVRAGEADPTGSPPGSGGVHNPYLAKAPVPG